MKQKIILLGLMVFLFAVFPFVNVGVAKNLKIGMVTDVGGVDDKSFNQSAWEGLNKAAKDFGIKVGYKESSSESDFKPNLDGFKKEGLDLIWGVGFSMEKAIKETALAHPNQKYAIIDVAYDNPPKNLCGVVFQEEEPSFLVGFIAGKMTKTNIVCFIGGKKFPIIEKFEYGYKAGVKLANPKCKVLTQYANSFIDAGIGKKIAEEMYGQNADIIFSAAGSVGDGVIATAKAKNKWAIGVDKDQNYLAPKNVLTSAMKRVDTAIYDIASRLKKGDWPGGTSVVYGLVNDGVGIAHTTGKHVPAEILQEVDGLITEIVMGNLIVPTTKNEFDSFSY